MIRQSIGSQCYRFNHYNNILKIAGKSFGAHVTAVCSFRSQSFVASLGADNIIDYTKTALFSEAVKYNIIFDIQGKIIIDMNS